MNQVYKKLLPYLERSMALQTATSIIEWDTETVAPEDASEYTAKAVGILSEQSFSSLMNSEVKEILKKLEKEAGLDDFEKVIVKKLTRKFQRMESISPQEMREFSEVQANSQRAWHKAKKSGDFSAFAPYLKKVIAFKKKYAKAVSDNLYDVLLDDYEETFTCEILDKFFDKLKKEIVPLLEQIEKKEPIFDDFLHQEYDIEKQKEFCTWLVGYIGFDFKRGILSESEHPFTTAWHNRDVRITTHYYSDNLMSSIFSVIHEGGHALYELGIADKYTQTMLGEGTSCGIHESQSRFFENMIGRSKAFWIPIYPKLVETFPEQLQNISLDQFILAINKVTPSLIRTEADELTYCLHIIVRYELEKAMINEDIDVEELPKLWKEKYREYLGVEPQNDTEGILQDVHWSMGDIGYFPSYALGNAFAAQIYHQMEQELDIDALLENQEISKITEYLRKHIHQYGAFKNARELLKDLTGEEFCPDYYIQYLKDKYSNIYQLNK